MQFLLDNFHDDSGLWTDHDTDTDISFPGGHKLFVRSEGTGWDEAGMQIITPRTLVNGDVFKIRFSIDDYHPGPLNQDNSNFLFSFTFADAFSSNSIGLNITPAGAYVQVPNETAQGPITPLASDVKYEVEFNFAENGCEVWLRGPHLKETHVGLVKADDPFPGRTAYVQFSLFSESTVRIYSIEGFNDNDKNVAGPF